MTKQLIKICGIEVTVNYKKIRNLHLRICVPHGEVMASAPMRYSLKQVEEFILKKIEWIKKSQAQILKLRDEGKIKMPAKLVSDEEHYLFGKAYLLQVLKNSRNNRVIVKDNIIELQVRGQSNFTQRQKILDDFYRQQLRQIIPQMITKYEKEMGVVVAEFGIKKMKTRWGTCNIRDKRIWLNLELAKKSPQFLESIVVHEMVHLLEASHNKRFYALMDQFMPQWRAISAAEKK